MATIPAFNPNAAYSAPTFDPSAAYTVAPKHDFSSLTANPKGEGTYQIETADGHAVAVPYSNVPVFTQGLQGSRFASPAEQTRFEKDAAADPHRPSFWNALTNPVGSGAHAQGVVGGAEQVGGQAIQTMAQPFMHPINTIEGIGKVASDALASGPVAAGVDVAQPAVEQYERDRQQGGNALALENLGGQVLGNVEGGRVAGAAVSGIEPSAATGAAGEAPAVGAEGPVNTVSRLNRLVPEAVRNGVLPSAWNWGTGAAKGAAKGAVTGDVNAPIAGSEPPLTPAARYESMKNMGMQPNAAEATNATPLNLAEKVNQNSLTAAPTYARARAANLAALQRFTDRALDNLSPVGPEAGGAAVQQGLRTAQRNLQENATQGFTQLDDVANRRLSGGTLQQTAKKIYDANAGYFAQHPSLVPGNAWKIVKDLAGKETEPAFQARPMTFGEVHQLRSDLLELVRSNPDIVKNQAGAWLQQLADAADRTMTSGVGGLNPKGLRVFRNANEAWANMKGTYDNPSHPFYSAVRTPTPSTLVKGIGQTPEMAKQLQAALGPEGIGPIQRGVAEKALGTTKEGGYNFKNFQGMWNKLPQAYREALFTPEQRQQFADIGNAGTVMHEDVNPSGTAKLGQGQAEMLEGSGALGAAATGHPLPAVGSAAYHATQYAVAKLMNSPTFVDWLMRDLEQAPTRPTVGPGMPAAVASGALASNWDWQNQQPKQ
jgi:hypothetical protein